MEDLVKIKLVYIEPLFCIFEQLLFFRKLDLKTF